jgi:ribonucleoside-diphosphate reductase alpha chain
MNEELKRERMPSCRDSITHKFTIVSGNKVIEVVDGVPTEVCSDLDGYVTVGFLENGQVGEIFLTIGKSGDQLKSLECLMVAVSIGLQYGIPLSVFVNKFEHVGFEPSGITRSDQIPIAKSIVDYVFRWLKMKFCDVVA